MFAFAYCFINFENKLDYNKEKENVLKTKLY